MSASSTVETGWTRSLKNGAAPDHANLADHLRSVHTEHAGFTESCAARCRDPQGRNSYEWLVEVIDPDRAGRVLDLACGSGPLLEICHRRFGERMALVGVDLSADELDLARERLPGRVVLHEALAQELDFLDDDSVDAILCHWALTLMDPVAPALTEARRVLAPGGCFAAIVDGDMDSAPGYRQVHDLIYGWVQRDYPHYGQVDMGDPRVRNTAALASLAGEVFDQAEVSIEPAVLTLDDSPETLAREAAGFFYAAFVLSPSARAGMLAELEALFADADGPTAGRFSMPINRLSVRLG